MKPKADGTKRVHLTTKGCSQIPGQHYDIDNIMSQVTNTFLMLTEFLIVLLSGFAGWVVDISGAFLLGEFKQGDPEIYREMAEGMQKWYIEYSELVMDKVKKCIYGT